MGNYIRKLLQHKWSRNLQVCKETKEELEQLEDEGRENDRSRDRRGTWKEINKLSKAVAWTQDKDTTWRRHN